MNQERKKGLWGERGGPGWEKNIELSWNLCPIDKSRISVRVIAYPQGIFPQIRKKLLFIKTDYFHLLENCHNILIVLEPDPVALSSLKLL